jgi:hypothetical protein
MNCEPICQSKTTADRRSLYTRASGQAIADEIINPLSINACTLGKNLSIRRIASSSGRRPRIYHRSPGDSDQTMYWEILVDLDSLYIGKPFISPEKMLVTIVYI